MGPNIPDQRRKDSSPGSMLSGSAKPMMVTARIQVRIHPAAQPTPMPATRQRRSPYGAFTRVP
jgi:hypothetical protein